MFKKVEDMNAQDIYKLLVSGIIPRPIAWVSTQNAQGVQNLAPYSFFTVASVNPPILAITHVAPRAGGEKDTLANLKVVPECVVNIVSAAQAEAMNASCAPYPNDTSEFEQAQIAAAPSELVKPVSVADSAVRYECKLREIINLSDLPAGGQLILLDVVGVSVKDGLLNEAGLVDAKQLDAIGKLGGDDYSYCRDGFALARPTL
jgi:flavin reductase (DIM6/NTAB) family NADH-FMN oxidoreductase RutF